jgi:HSP20 family protein
MIVRYWQPWREIETLRHQMDKAFDQLISSTEEAVAWVPAVELKDGGSDLVLRVQLPGLEAKDLDVQVTREAVTIAGEQRHEQTNENEFFKSEFRYGRFYRVVALPVPVQNDQVQAEYKDGILSLRLPKVAEARNKVVKLNLAEQLNQTSAQVMESSQEPTTSANFN